MDASIHLFLPSFIHSFICLFTIHTHIDSKDFFVDCSGGGGGGGGGSGSGNGGNDGGSGSGSSRGGGGIGRGGT